MTNKFKRLFIGALMVFLAQYAVAQGHYVGGSFNTNDYFVPPSPGWVFTLFYSYSNTNFYNSNGQKADIIQLSQNPPVNIAMGQKVQTHSIIPMGIYFGKKKIFNANWGILALPMINNPNASIALDYYLGQSNVAGQKIDIHSFGLGDMYLQPVWLTWNKKKLSVTFSYGIWLPIGKYSANSPENVGLGYWSHNIRFASRYKPSAPWAFTGALTYEISSQQKDVNFTEAPHLSLDLASSYNFPKGHELGLFGFGTWQTGTDKGQKAILPPDRIGGLGVYGAYWFVPGKFSAMTRFTGNFGTRNRYGGFAFQFGLNYLIM
jgi:hypothetical protein